VEALIKGGEVVPYWTMKPSSGRESWSLSVEAISNLGEMFGVKLVKDTPITPNQARKLGIPDELIKQYSSRKAGLQLARETNRSVTTWQQTFK
jgi:hypothetical protein